MDGYEFLKVSSLRNKLKEEIEYAETIVDTKGGVFNTASLQANIFCIAALSRGILEYLPDKDSYTIEVVERSTDKHCSKNISLYSLLGKMVHYIEYMPHYNDVLSVADIKSIRLISDHDKKHYGIKMRVISLPEFFKLARTLVDSVKPLLVETQKRFKAEEGKIMAEALEAVRKHENT